MTNNKHIINQLLLHRMHLNRIQFHHLQSTDQNHQVARACRPTFPMMLIQVIQVFLIVHRHHTKKANRNVNFHRAHQLHIVHHLTYSINYVKWAMKMKNKNVIYSLNVCKNCGKKIKLFAEIYQVYRSKQLICIDYISMFVNKMVFKNFPK